VIVPRYLAILFLLVSSLPGMADSAGWPTWVSLEVPADREAASVALLEGGGITVLSWGNALVEVSDFDGVELHTAASVESALTPWDPRWDPWLKGLEPVFRPGGSVSRLWVEASRWDAAQRLLGGQPASGGSAGAGARKVTGWLVLAFAAFFFALRLAAQAASKLLGSWRAWRWFPLTLAVLAGGLLMTGRGRRPRSRRRRQPPGCITCGTSKPGPTVPPGPIGSPA